MLRHTTSTINYQHVSVMTVLKGGPNFTEIYITEVHVLCNLSSPEKERFIKIIESPILA